MSLTVKTPGVYIQEVSTLPASVVPVETAIPAFVGYTEIDPGEVKRIGSMVEFEQHFGGPNSAIDVTFNFVSGSPSTSSLGTITSPTLDHYLWYAMQLFYANGGGDCYVSSAGAYKTGAGSDFTNASLALHHLLTMHHGVKE